MGHSNWRAFPFRKKIEGWLLEFLSGAYCTTSSNPIKPFSDAKHIRMTAQQLRRLQQVLLTKIPQADFFAFKKKTTASWLIEISNLFLTEPKHVGPFFGAFWYKKTVGASDCAWKATEEQCAETGKPFLVQLCPFFLTFSIFERCHSAMGRVTATATNPPAMQWPMSQQVICGQTFRAKEC